MSDIELPNVVCLTQKRRQYTREECGHFSILIDEELLEVECEKCHAKVNPVAWMLKRMRELNQKLTAQQGYEEAVRAYAIKSRCKCEHCGRITSIRHPTRKEIEMAERARVAEGSLVIVGAPEEQS